MKQNPFTLARAVEKDLGSVFSMNFGYLLIIFESMFVTLFLSILFFEWMINPSEPFLFMLWSRMPILLVEVGAAMLYTLVLTRGMRVRVTETEVHSVDYWGLRYSLNWAEMETVQSKSIAGLPYLRVTSFRSRRALYIPCFLARQEAFRRAVSATASPVNPLRWSVENADADTERTRLPM